MRKRAFCVFLIAGCGAEVTGTVLRGKPSAIQAPNPPGTVSLEAAAKKLKRGRTYDFQVRVDLTAVNAPGANQPAAIGSYVVPISFDRSALEYVSASGGDTSAFAS